MQRIDRRVALAFKRLSYHHLNSRTKDSTTGAEFTDLPPITMMYAVFYATYATFLAAVALGLSSVDGSSSSRFNSYPSLHFCSVASDAAPTAAPTTEYPIVGLQNLGNTCYLNAQMQCLFHIPYVRDIILRDPSHFESDEPSPAYIGLRQLFSDMEESSQLSGRAVTPSVLCQLIDIPVNEQQDSQEFWKLLLPALKVPKLIDLYTGTYENYIVALDGSHRERRFRETFLDLSLDVPTAQETESASILDSLSKQFHQPELLSAATGNAWRPSPDAVEKVDAHKGYRLIVYGLPSILQLHLKRFHFDWNTETINKLNHAITFPSQLDLTSVVAPEEDRASDDSNDDCIYELQAVVVHVGEYHSGHYYSYVRPDVRTNDWYRFNDEIHTKVRVTDVFRDSYGGMVQCNGEAAQTDAAAKAKDKGNRLVRIFRSIFGLDGDTSNEGGYGYGGPKSNAYVLQYIRRKDIAKLYDGGPYL
jgi:ubiquitin C-terminal hydrolase